MDPYNVLIRVCVNAIPLIFAGNRDGERCQFLRKLAFSDECVDAINDAAFDWGK